MIPGTTASRGHSPIIGVIGFVRFDNELSTSLLNVSGQSVTDSALFTVSTYVRFQSIANQSVIALGDGSGGDLNKIFIDSGQLSCFLTNNPGAVFTEFVFTGVPFVADQVHHIFLSVDTNHAAGLKICNFLLDGATQTLNTGASTDTDPAHTISFNGGEFGVTDVVADSPNGYHTDFQHLWIAPGQYVAPANVTLFRDAGTGDPVDLGADGSTPTGTAPKYFFEGNAAAFSTNLGSGAQPVLTGTLTDV